MRKKNTMKYRYIISAVLIFVSLIFASTVSAAIFSDDITPAEERKVIQSERKDILKKMFQKRPELKAQVEAAPGYATFSVININVLLIATQRGTGIVVNNNKMTYMDVISVGGGVGAGVKDLMTLIIFKDQKAIDQFINSGWEFGASADVAAKSGDKGAELSETASMAVPTEAELKGPMRIYVLTEAGVSAQATISGVKFSKDDELNK